MRKITDTLYYNNYKFDVEFDMGSGTGANLWCIIPLKMQPRERVGP